MQEFTSERMQYETNSCQELVSQTFQPVFPQSSNRLQEPSLDQSLEDDEVHGHVGGDSDFQRRRHFRRKPQGNSTEILTEDEDNTLSTLVQEFKILKGEVEQVKSDNIRLKQALSDVVDEISLRTMGYNFQEDIQVDEFTQDDTLISYSDGSPVDEQRYYRAGTPNSAPGDLDRRWIDGNVAVQQSRRRSWPIYDKEFDECVDDPSDSAAETEYSSESDYDLDSADEGEDAPFIPDDPPIQPETTTPTGFIHQISYGEQTPSWQPSFGFTWSLKQNSKRRQRRYPLPRVRHNYGDFLTSISCVLYPMHVHNHHELFGPSYTPGTMSAYIEEYLSSSYGKQPASQPSARNQDYYPDLAILEVPEEDEQEMLQQMNRLWYQTQDQHMTVLYDKTPIQFVAVEPLVHHETVI
ncbi:hypothetical protein M422DRAFT_51767 [Sphaerobolus stellatus SS14]|uniref:Uncharacterized protein n=1 Tax=Sphaerobolus stellatus (strain SS14) TaxID=990650 RepID=A0A0C9UIY0_SPHS4|nr:hypothetical protein M422DRAFT_51767 [Sphaerobolus stellatus SS14]